MLAGMAETARMEVAVGAAAEVLTPEEVIRLLRLNDRAPQRPREALRRLVRRGRLACLRDGPGSHSRMVFLRRHVEECLARWEQWGRWAGPAGEAKDGPGRLRASVVGGGG